MEYYFGYKDTILIYIHTFNQYLLGTLYSPGSVLSARREFATKQTFPALPELAFSYSNILSAKKISSHCQRLIVIKNVDSGVNLCRLIPLHPVYQLYNFWQVI